MYKIVGFYLRVSVKHEKYQYLDFVI
jgi:hypothetical protein